MARPVRFKFPAASYRVNARGNERRAIFKHDADRAPVEREARAGGVVERRG